MRSADEQITMGVKINGGLETNLICLNYLHCLYKYIDDARAELRVYATDDCEINSAVYENQPAIASYSKGSEWALLVESDSENSSFALLLELDVYPRIVYKNDELINASEKLTGLVGKWEEFGEDVENELYYRYGAKSLPYVYSRLIIQKRNFLNSADIDGTLGIGSDFKAPVNIFRDEKETLEKLGISGKKFITVHRGIFSGLNISESTLLWPESRYNELIKRIKAEFPEYPIVQTGTPEEHYNKLEGVDIDLTENASWDDIKILLKNAVLHIDSDSGQVYLRKALKAKPSLVFFGPTPAELFGCEGNFNLRGTGCAHWCAELRDDWEYHCSNRAAEKQCLLSITPEAAFEAIFPYLNDERCQ